jgi:heme exporter protein B
VYLTLLKRELALHVAGVGELLAVPALYLLAVSFYVMSQPHGEVQAAGAGAMVWVAALLSLGLTQYRIWERDVEDGTLEQWAMLPLALEWVVVAKLLAHWLMAGLPLVILAPLLMLLLGIDNPLAAKPLLALLLGTLSLTALGSVAGAISQRFAFRQLLTLLLVFPMAVPVLIFGASGSGLPLLAAYTLAILPLAVAATAQLLKIVLRS